MPATPVLPRVHAFRGQRIMLDADLARLYGVSTMAFNQAIRRNRRRFPPDFILEIPHCDFSRLISQIVISNSGPPPRTPRPTATGRGGRRKPALAFTEHGAIMAATILRSPRAVAMSVYVVRAFVQMREALLANATILKHLAQLDRKLLEHDVVLRDICAKLRPLLTPPPEPPHKEMGFHTRLKKS